MTTAPIQEVISCTLVEASEKISSRGQKYLEFIVERADDDRGYKQKYSAWIITPELDALSKAPRPQQYNLLIQRGGVKRDKPDNGQKYNYFWDVLSVGGEVAPPPPRTVTSAAAPSLPPGNDPRQESIERQVALKEAVHAAVTSWGDYKTTEQLVNQVAELYAGFYGLLANGSVPASGPTSPVQPPEGSPATTASEADDPWAGEDL
jgi:hypothetical protein